MKTTVFHTIYIVFFAFLLLISCNPAAHISEENYLLDKYSIEITDEKKVDEKELKKYIQKAPNKKIFGVKFYLWLYNLSDEEKDNWWHNWLRQIGEAPVVYDPFSVQKTRDQFKLYLKGKGYYESVVEDSVIFRNEKAEVYYKIHPKNPLKINNIRYQIRDSALQDILYADTVNRIIQKGDLLDVDLLENERSRITNYLNNNGYFAFSKEYITYEGDTLLTGNQVNLTINVNPFKYQKKNGESVILPHKIYQVADVFVFPAYERRLNRGGSRADTIPYKDIHFISTEPLTLNREILYQSIYIAHDDQYNENDVRQTYKHLNSLDIYKIVNIQFLQVLTEKEFIRADTATLICHIQLTKSVPQSYSIELEGTNSSGNLGGATSLSYGHKNIFNGFETFNLRLRGAFETLRRTDVPEFDNTVELGAETRLEVQKFLLPIRTEQFIKRFNPFTNLSFAYNYQKRPDYTRTIANMKFGYEWHAGKFFTHFVNPLEFNIVTIPRRSTTFLNEIRGTYLEYSYQPHVVSVAAYNMVFNNQSIRKRDNFVFARFNAESAGNLLSGIKSLTSRDKEPGEYEIFRTRYAQFLRSDIDFRYYQIINKENKLAYRLFFGLGYPYGNSAAMPFEKKYFSGGANSIRAWQIRTLGPGSTSKDSVITSFPNQTGDIKLEANFEYRYRLIGNLEGAVFVDAGNIWAITRTEEVENPGSLFKADRFYKQIAVGTGTGFRYDLSFFIFRMDLGMKLHDPGYPSGERWVFDRPFHFGRAFNITIGIGYPF